MPLSCSDVANLIWWLHNYEGDDLRFGGLVKCFVPFFGTGRFMIYFCVLHLQGKGGLLFWECSNVNLHANIKGLSEQVEHSNRYFGRNVVPDL